MGDERWEVLESAAARLEFKASQATEGPWWRPTRLPAKNVVLADVQREERGEWPGMTDPVVVVLAQALKPTHRLVRRQSGRDLEYIALMNPRIGKAVADVLRSVALEMKEADSKKKKLHGWEEPESWGACLRLAHRIMRTGETKRYGE